MGIRVNKAKLSEILGKSEAALSDWQREGMPFRRGERRGQANTYDTEEVIEWLVGRATGKTTAGQEKLNIQTEKAKLLRAQAQRAEIEASLLTGELVRADEVEAELSNVVVRIRSKLLALPARLAAQVVTAPSAAQVEALLLNGMCETLEELSVYDGKYDDAESGRAEGTEARPAEVPTAAPADSKPVGGQVPVPKPRSKRRARTVEHQ